MRTTAAWAKVQAFMKKGCGVVLSAEQEYLLEARLGPLVCQFGCRSLEELVDEACASLPSTPISRALIDAMTTHETLFFRDAQFWRALTDRFLPQLVAEAGKRRLRFWSAACSHGQEPYSLALVLEEQWPEVAAKAEIIGTDVSQPAIERAREGVYSALEVNRGLGAVRIARHFEQVQGGFRVRQHLRERIRWSVHNLLGPNQDPNSCDVVMCRNVLIYFSDQDRRSTLERIEAAARPGGFIALGGTESTPRAQLAPGWYAKTLPQRTVSL